MKSIDRLNTCLVIVRYQEAYLLERKGQTTLKHLIKYMKTAMILENSKYNYTFKKMYVLLYYENRLSRNHVKKIYRICYY